MSFGFFCEISAIEGLGFRDQGLGSIGFGV